MGVARLMVPPEYNTRVRGEILGQAGGSGITRIGGYLTFLVL